MALCPGLPWLIPIIDCSANKEQNVVSIIKIVADYVPDFLQQYRRQPTNTSVQC